MTVDSDDQPDPNCVHCVLQAPLLKFMEEHPEQRPVQIFGGLLDLAASYLASKLPRKYRTTAMIDGPALLQRHLREAFEEANGINHGRH